MKTLWELESLGLTLVQEKDVFSSHVKILIVGIGFHRSWGSRWKCPIVSCSNELGHSDEKNEPPLCYM